MRGRVAVRWPTPDKYRCDRWWRQPRGRMIPMSTIYSFERQPYLRELEVEILRVEEKSGAWGAILDDTILYPEGGGQPSDYGRLNDVGVQHVQKTRDGLLHVLAAPVQPGMQERARKLATIINLDVKRCQLGVTFARFAASISASSCSRETTLPSTTRSMFVVGEP